MQFIETIQSLQNRLHPHQDLLDRIVAAQAWAKQRLDQPISLDEMAAYACVSPFYFIRQFRKVYGCTPQQYLIRLRMQQARHLLAEGHSVMDTAAAVGFESLPSFSRQFKVHTGCCPLLWQQQKIRRGNSLAAAPPICAILDKRIH